MRGRRVCVSCSPPGHVEHLPRAILAQRRWLGWASYPRQPFTVSGASFLGRAASYRLCVTSVLFPLILTPLDNKKQKNKHKEWAPMNGVRKLTLPHTGLHLILTLNIAQLLYQSLFLWNSANIGDHRKNVLSINWTIGLWTVNAANHAVLCWMLDHAPVLSLISAAEWE